MVIPCRYEEVPALVLKGEADVGLIIHETRFVFQEMGLIELADLGSLLSERYRIPIPLGLIAARRDLSSSILEEVISSIEQSVRFALSNPTSSRAYILTHSQEKDAQVIDQHIATYVNQETVRMSKQGIESVKTFFALAIERGILPKEATL
jgi:1,4-dihydroxy-6-naphthoate synthase